MKKIALQMGAALLAFMPAALAACPACMGKELPRQVQDAYVLSTGALSLIPLLMLGGIVFWVYKRNKAARENG